jgi:type IV secretion system protein VirD4
MNKFLSKIIGKFATGIVGTIIHYLVLLAIFWFISMLVGFGFYKSNNQDMEIAKKVIFQMTDILNFVALIIAIFSYKHYKTLKRDKYQTFGKARFSELEEVLKQGLQGNGIVFGRFKNKLITKPPTVEGHTLIVGGTGTGKSRGIVIPTMLQWQGSCVCMDIKGEISKITATRREMQGKVYIFNPEGNGACYDPIKLCDTLDQAQDLARTLIPISENSSEPFFAKSAQSILSAFVFEGAKKGYKLSDIAEKLCTSPINELIEHCKNSEIREVKLLCSIAYDTPEKTLGNVMAELKSRLITIATDENIRRATSKSDWTPESLEYGATIYLKISEHLLDQYKDILTVIINQILKYLSKREEKKEPPILIAIDEMPRLSKIENLTNALSTLRSKNAHILAIIQSMAQLDLIYTKDARKVIADNCRFKFILSATDVDTQKYFSDLVGQRTAMAKGVTVGAGLIPNMSSSEQGTPLIRPEEWSMLPKPILLAPNIQPTQLDLAFWDKENF